MNIIAILVAASILCCIGIVDAKYLIYSPRRGINNWNDAVNFCKRRNSNIVKIETRGEWNVLSDILKCERGDKGDGWYIGGRARNGRWSWEDGTSMRFKNFASDSRLFPLTGTQRTVYNYAYVPTYGRKWKYVSRRSSNRLGVICERKCQ